MNCDVVLPAGSLIAAFTVSPYGERHSAFATGGAAMSSPSVRQRFAFIGLLIILSVFLPAGSPHVVAQQPQAVPVPSFRSSSVVFNENAGQFAAGAPDEEIAVVLASATQVTADEAHTCALTAAGGVKCWGRFTYKS